MFLSEMTERQRKAAEMRVEARKRGATDGLSSLMKLAGQAQAARDWYKK